MKNLFDLSEKNIVITGGASWLGSAMSEALIEFGASVIITERRVDKAVTFVDEMNRKYGSNTVAKQLDISDSSSVNNCFAEINKDFGKIDVLINNASYVTPGTFDSMSYDEWSQGIDGTINAVFRVSSEAIKYMILNRNGNIINISSMYGVVSPNPEIYGESGLNNPPNYGAGKAAIVQLTKYIACHYAKYGIRANAISPGAFPSKKVQENNEFVQNLCKKNPLGRIGTPNDLKGIIVLLASDASSYMTGQNISVDGGWTSW